MDLEIDVKRNRFILKDKKIFHKFSRRKHTVQKLLILAYNPVKCSDIELDFIKGNQQLIYFKISDLKDLSEKSRDKISGFLKHNINSIMEIFDKEEDYWYAKFINDKRCS